uniref:Uncharacterized protein n=1 Tax=Talaromyces marneffei PM1 TaxID=1077442 RepID=A0A093W3J8_TALMA
MAIPTWNGKMIYRYGIQSTRDLPVPQSDCPPAFDPYCHSPSATGPVYTSASALQGLPTNSSVEFPFQSYAPTPPPETHARRLTRTNRFPLIISSQPSSSGLSTRATAHAKNNSHCKPELQISREPSTIARKSTN